jgi:hypothetical protein
MIGDATLCVNDEAGPLSGGLNMEARTVTPRPGAMKEGISFLSSFQGHAESRAGLLGRQPYCPSHEASDEEEPEGLGEGKEDYFTNQEVAPQAQSTSSH